MDEWYVCVCMCMWSVYIDNNKKVNIKKFSIRVSNIQIERNCFTVLVG